MSNKPVFTVIHKYVSYDSHSPFDVSFDEVVDFTTEETASKYVSELTADIRENDYAYNESYYVCRSIPKVYETIADYENDQSNSEED